MTAGASRLWRAGTSRSPRIVSRGASPPRWRLQPDPPLPLGRPPLGPGLPQRTAAPGRSHPPGARLSPSLRQRWMFHVDTAGTRWTCPPPEAPPQVPGVVRGPAGSSHRSCDYTGAPVDNADLRCRSGNKSHTQALNTCRCKVPNSSRANLQV